MKKEVYKIFIDRNVICPRRELESFKVKKYFEANDCKSVEKPKQADFILLFTCAVRKIEENIAFRLIEKYKKLKGELIVLGCLPSISEKRLIKEFKGKYFSVKNFNRLDFLFPQFHNKYSEIPDPVNFEDNDFFKKNSIAKIKIAEGCSGNCSYCIIKVAMGGLKSFSLEYCCDVYKNLIKKGHRNFEMNSEDVGGYGIDIGTTLPELFSKFSEVDRDLKVFWTVFNVAPQWVVKYENELLYFIKERKIIELKCDIQSGSERILKLMNRYHDLGKIFKIFKNFKKENPDLKFFNQSIIGFPGETESEFQETLEVIEELAPHRMQFFTYGDDSRVQSSNLPDKINEKIKKKRLEKACRYFLQRGYRIHRKLEGTIFLIKK